MATAEDGADDEDSSERTESEASNNSEMLGFKSIRGSIMYDKEKNDDLAENV